MTTTHIRPAWWSISAVEQDRRGFNVASYTEDGVQYQSYLLDTGDGWALLGSMPERYSSAWLESIKKIAGDGVRWAVLFGTDDDRAAVRAVLAVYPQAVLIGGENSLFRLEGFTATDGFCQITVRGSRTLTLGKKVLSFRVLQEKRGSAPLYVIDEADGVLLTADAFGSGYASQRALVSELADRDAYFRGVERHFADIFGAKRPESMSAAAELVKEHHISLICPSRGPVVDAELERLLAVSTKSPSGKDERLTLALVYSPGNYVVELAQTIAAGVRESGEVAVMACDLSEMNRDAALKKLPDADGYLFGTPEVNDDAAKGIWDVVTSLQREDCQGKPAAVFCSADSIGSAAQNLRARLGQLGCGLNWQDYLLQGRPDGQSLKAAREYGYDIGCALQKIPNPRKPKLMKCLVCGEIFDASLGTCPVCGVGLEQCVPVEEDETAYRKDTENRYLILGGGIAAVSAAEAIRLRDGTGGIVVLSAEDYLPINRPMLTKDLDLVFGDPSALLIHDRAWYDERNIDLHLGISAVALDTAGKTVSASDDRTYSYDKLIYATGAECFIPPIEGHDKSGVLTIRHLWDSQELRRRMDEGARSAVVIGGGVLGLEAASELMRSGLKVTVLEAASQIIGRQADAQSAALLRTAMEKLGVACYEGVSIAAIEGAAQASGVRLADGRVFPADIVVVSCGNRANIQAAKAAGIETDRAIVVNQRMETSVPDVYACGDCCQLNSVNLQLWQEASNQGRVAGANAAGDTAAFANQPLGLSLEGFGTSLFAMGDPGKRENVPYKTVELRDGVSGRHETYWFFGGSLEGAVAIGAPEKTADISRAVSTHARYAELFP